MTTPRDPDAVSTASGTVAHALLSELVRGGVRDVVVCPGSRSQALAIAAARFERAGLLRLRVRIDERSAGFLALGLALETGTPVPVIVTSGTALANLAPAVLEASHAGVPLIVVSGDRPAELRGTGANQTTRQPGLFGDAVRVSVDLDAEAGGEPAAIAAARDALAADAPAHLNVALREPLSDAVDRRMPSPGPRVAPARETRVHETPVRPGTVVIAGADAGEDAERLARDLGAPLLAEVSSGARFGPNLVAAYRELLGTDARRERFGADVRRAIVLGHPTLSREVPQLLGRDDVEVIVVRGRGRDVYAPPGSDPRVVDALAAARDPVELAAQRPWVGRWVYASRELLEVEEAPAANTTLDYRERSRFARAELERLRAPVTRRELVEAVWSATWPHDRLLLGASRLIRELDRVATGKKIPVFANRGLSGIDGTVSTGVGIALGAAEAGSATAGGTTRVLLGDLALLHDVGGMLFPDGEERPSVQLIVGNDGGGTIFDSLEVARADPALFERVQLTPQSASLRELAAAYGWEHRLVATRGDLDQQLTASGTPVLIEVPLSR